MKNELNENNFKKWNETNVKIFIELCIDKIKQIIHKMNINELYIEMENHKNGKCKFFENGKPNKNIIISYDD